MSRDEFLNLMSKCGNDPGGRDIIGVKKMMDRFGVDAVLNARDKNSLTCLFGAAKTFDPSLLMFLLQKGANPDTIYYQRSFFGGSWFMVPLNIVVNMAGAELILAYGANVTLLNSLPAKQ